MSADNLRGLEGPQPLGLALFFFFDTVGKTV